MKRKMIVLTMALVLSLSTVGVYAENSESAERTISVEEDIRLTEDDSLDEPTSSVKTDDLSEKDIIQKIITREKDEKDKDELLDESYYDENSNWSKTFSELGAYVGDRNPEEVFDSLNNDVAKGKEIDFDDDLARMAYNDLLHQEYIVDLINVNSEVKTTIDNWKFNLQFLNENYELILENPNVNMENVDLYIEQYTWQLKTEDLPDYKPTTPSIQPFSTQTFKNNVIAYIDKYWQTPNSVYPYCPNYNYLHLIVQALFHSVYM